MAEDVKDIEYVSYETLDHVIYKLSKVYSGGQSEEIKWPIPIEKGGSGATTADDAWTAFGGGSVGKLNINSNAETFLNGSGQWSTPKDTTYELATSAAPGLMPALSASATQYLNGNGEWTTVDNIANAAKAASADKLTTGHTITVQNGNAAAATSAAFDGTSNVTINLSNLDATTLTTGTIPLARIPQGALERIVDVANQAARFALTNSQVQLGDTVRQLDTGVMYVVVDESKLNQAAGYVEYAAGTALEAEHAKTADTATSANTATSATSAGSATTANSAAKLTSPRSLKTKLDSTTDVTFDGSGDQNAIPVIGTLGIANGGTGKTNAAEAWTNLGGGSVGKLNTNGTATQYLNGSGQWSTPPNTDTNVKQDVSTANTAYPILLKNGTGNGSVTTTALFDEAVTINPSTNTITATTFVGNVTGNVSGSSGSCTGNAATATTLQNSRNLAVALGTANANGVGFNGGANQLAIPVTGTLAISNGGTGSTARNGALYNLEFIGVNPTGGTANDTMEKWKALGNGWAWFTATEQLNGQPSQYGFLINRVYSGEVHQEFWQQSNGAHFWRGGNGSTTAMPSWKTALDSNNYTNYTVTKTGSGASGSWGISVTGSSASCTGNAATASKLGTSTIGGTAFPIYLNGGTATKCTDMGTVYVGTSAPTDSNYKLWIDTSS